MTQVRARGRYWFADIVSALVLLLGGASVAAGQVQAVGQQDLSFGVLVPGVPGVVLPDDAARRAEWLLTGRGRVTVSFVLPTVLQGPNGASIPLVFGATDGMWERQGRGGGRGPQPVDPNTPFSVTVPNRQTVVLYLGGTAAPTLTQAAGTYTATITVIVAQP